MGEINSLAIIRRKIEHFCEMKKIIAILFFLPLAITADPMEDYSLDLRYDITKFLMNSIYEILQEANPHVIRNSYDELTLQHQPFVTGSEINNDSKNITFSKFFSDNEIISFLELEEIDCFRDSLNIYLKSINAERKTKSIEGNVKFLRPVNDTLACQLPFNITYYTRGYISLNIKYPNQSLEKQTFDLHSMFDEYEDFCQPSNNDEILCMKAHEDQLRFIYRDILDVIEHRIIDRVEIITRSSFQSISAKCRQLINAFDANTQEYYVYLKLDNNLDVFPWMNDYNEIIIRGLTNIKILNINYEYNSYNMYSNNVSIIGNITSLESRRYRFEVETFHMNGEIDNKLTMKSRNIQLSLITIKDIRNMDSKFLEEIMMQLNENIADGIERTCQRIPCTGDCNGTNIAKNIAEILRPLDIKTFENLFLNPEETTRIDFANGTVSFSKVEIKGISHLENLSCSLPEYSMIGWEVYETMKTEIDYLITVNEERISKVSISGDLLIENATVRIFFNLTKQLEVNIEHTFNESSTIIRIDPGYYRLRQKERTGIGKQIFREFVKMIKDRIIRTMKSILKPISKVCPNSFSNIAESRTNRHNVRENFFASIEDRWDDATTSKPVDIIIKGWWNYEFINIQHVNDAVILSNLRMEDITIITKQFHIDPEKTISTSYNISNIFLTVNHKDKDVQVDIPGLLVDHATLSSAQNKTNVSKNIERTIASLIEQSLYGNDPSYHEKYRKLVYEAMQNGIRGCAPMKYDGSSIFKHILAYKVKCVSDLSYSRYQGFKFLEPAESKANYSTETEFRFEPFNLTMSTRDFSITVYYKGHYIREDICNYSDNSLAWMEIKDNISLFLKYNGYVEIKSEWANQANPFTIEISRVELYYDAFDAPFQLKANLNDENIQLKLLPEFEEIRRNFTKTEEDDLRKKVVQIASSFLNKRLDVLQGNSPFCKVRLNEMITDEKESASLTPLQMRFYSINKTIQYTSRRFLMYHIQIYGLQNFKKVRIERNATHMKFEFKIVDLKAHILWSYYIGGLIPKVPMLKEIILQIDEILLAGDIGHGFRILRFSDNSRLKIRNTENASKLEKTFGPIVLESIQDALTDENRKNLEKYYW